MSEQTNEQRLIEACENMQKEILQLHSRVQYLEGIIAERRNFIPPSVIGPIHVTPQEKPVVTGPTCVTDKGPGVDPNYWLGRPLNTGEAPFGWVLPGEGNGPTAEPSPRSEGVTQATLRGLTIPGNWHLDIDPLTPEDLLEFQKKMTGFYDKAMYTDYKPQVILHPPVEEDGA